MANAAISENAKLTVRSVLTQGVRVPLRFALGTSAAVVRTVPLLLVDLLTEQGIVGHAYLFCYTPSGARAVAGHVVEAVELAKGKAATPLSLAVMLARRYALLGVTGPVQMALAVIDLALWDALAISLGQPVAALLGATPQPINAYDSRGLGLMDPARLSEEALALLEKGLKAVKLRLGYSTLGEDLIAVRAVRKSVPDNVLVMVDYNQALTPTEAILRGRAIQDEGIAWLEEPIRHNDYRGNAAVARALTVPIQLGENSTGQRPCWRPWQPMPVIMSCLMPRGSAV
jgi:mandelate racemase